MNLFQHLQLLSVILASSDVLLPVQVWSLSRGISVYIWMVAIHLVKETKGDMILEPVYAMSFQIILGSIKHTYRHGRKVSRRIAWHVTFTDK